jgi:Rrf2 family protein
MLSSSRFVVAVHVLSLLAKNAGKGPICSSTIACSVGTNPVVIRRLMSELEKSGLILATAGRSGGFSLSKSAVNVSLADIYNAVEDDEVFRMHKLDPNSECPVAGKLRDVLVPKLRAAECALTTSLQLTSLHDVACTIQ